MSDESSDDYDGISGRRWFTIGACGRYLEDIEYMRKTTNGQTDTSESCKIAGQGPDPVWGDVKWHEWPLSYRLRQASGISGAP